MIIMTITCTIIITIELYSSFNKEEKLELLMVCTVHV